MSGLTFFILVLNYSFIFIYLVFIIITIILIFSFSGSLHLLGKFIPVLWVSYSIHLFSIIVRLCTIFVFASLL